MADDAAPAMAARKASAARYAAFISYSHADSEMCDRLHRRLESYVVPHSLVGRAGPQGKVGKRLGKFFRDRVDLGAHHDLGAEIREALDQSAALIVLCSPHSSGSKYVNEEIRYFKSLGRSEQVFAAIIAGEPHAAAKPGLSAAEECFPQALIYRVGANGTLTGEPEAAEPIAADFRDKKDGLENGALKLIAGLLDIGLDDLVQREKQAEARRRRQAYIVSGVMGVLAIGAGVGGVLAWLNGETVKAQAARIEDNVKALEANKIEIETKNASLQQQLLQNQSLTTRITSVVGEISGIAEKDDAISEELLFLSFGARLGISAWALNGILDSHIGKAEELKINNYGGGRMCMGVDYCDRQFTVENMKADWGAMLAPDEIARLAAVWGVKPAPKGADWEAADPNFTAIKRTLATVSDIKISRRDAIRVFGRVQLPRFCDDVRRIWPDADLLPPDSFGALVYAVVYFGPTDAEKMAADVRAGKYPDVPAGIRAMGRQRAAFVPSQRIAAAVLKWSEEQAQMYERGFAAPAPAVVGVPGKPG